MTRLGIDIDYFLSRYWQREALLLPAALPDFQPPLSADELAGLAMEPEVESRLIRQRDDGSWHLRHGPFSARDYPDQGAWTLLVQAVDHYVPEVAAMLRLVDFIPDWRADDVMISYASDGGSVGPHYDLYDVFLVQGEGQRLWRLGQRCDHNSALLPDCDLRILQHFDTRTEYLLNPGDILYVPPGLAHWGIAKGECTSYSIGFRAPRQRDLLARLTDQLLAADKGDQLYRDPGRAACTRAGEISIPDIERARQQLMALFETDTSPEWLGELVTEPRYELEASAYAHSEIEALLSGDAILSVAPESRLAWSAQDVLYVFANGQTLTTDLVLTDIVLQLCATRRLRYTAPAASVAPAKALSDLFEFLLATGSCYVE